MTPEFLYLKNSETSTKYKARRKRPGRKAVQQGREEHAPTPVSRTPRTTGSSRLPSEDCLYGSQKEPSEEIGDSNAGKEKGIYYETRDQRAHSPMKSRTSKSWSTRVDGSQYWRRSASIVKESTFTHKRLPPPTGGPSLTTGSGQGHP